MPSSKVKCPKPPSSPADFEWNPTAYQQLHLSLTREDIQRQANKATLARPA
ncbi:hypothetical protein ACFSC4_20785 [Deinococcus malanensis]|uniref:hypothetical protein n=1 Tax=Deinococcus malanensis TaxID=1706855 RepID=UPI00364591C0